MRRILNLIFNRIFITAMIVAIQAAFIVIQIERFSNQAWYISQIMTALSVIVVFFILYKKSNPAVKLAWIVPILLFPIFGGILYLAFGHLFIPRKMKKNIDNSDKLGIDNLVQDEAVFDELKNTDADISSQSKYLIDYACAPVWQNTDATYFNDGEPYWEALLNDLKSAEKFIFLEFFIVAEGKMWSAVLDILKEKVDSGVEVRVIYDDFGSAGVLPNQYYLELRKAGIDCIAFNRIIPFFTMILNNRDHRKIVVIDGKIGYTGGINLADEYINKKPRFGYWKDAGLRLQGDAVWNMTVLFLQMWNITRNTDQDISMYRADEPSVQCKGFVQPYGDTPLDDELVGENTYLNIINHARDYIWIYTPYLIMDNVMMESLKLAAKRGVDVRIVTPGIPDKKMVFYMTRCSYKELMEAGARIYEYTPGFIHAKCTLCDDELVDIGTVNYDYRSLYHHFECGVLLYQTNVTKQLKQDMLSTYEVSEEITPQLLHKWRFNTNVAGPILHLFAPLL